MAHYCSSTANEIRPAKAPKATVPIIKKKKKKKNLYRRKRKPTSQPKINT